MWGRVVGTEAEEKRMSKRGELLRDLIKSRVMKGEDEGSHSL